MLKNLSLTILPIFLGLSLYFIYVFAILPHMPVKEAPESRFSVENSDISELGLNQTYIITDKETGSKYLYIVNRSSLFGSDTSMAEIKTR